MLVRLEVFEDGMNNHSKEMIHDIEKNCFLEEHTYMIV